LATVTFPVVENNAATHENLHQIESIGRRFPLVEPIPGRLICAAEFAGTET